ncbi:MAG: hypothetical protein NUW01_16905, partial [Gemmatimonadaceae bacterium]|nr:hypothetical protein [Gemmatimonadaceae bacterium]
MTTVDLENSVRAAFGSGELARGSAAEVAGRLAAALERVTTQPLVYDMGTLWHYRPATGTWWQLDDSMVTRLVMRLDGTGCMESGRPLKVSGALWRDVNAALTALPHERSGFFARALSGLAFANGFL